MLPETSLEAYHDLNLDGVREMYQKILSALKTLKKANYDTIATHLGLSDKNMVSRRTKEMEQLEMIYKPGTKSLTSRNRNAYDYSIRTPDTIVPELEKFNPDEKHTADYANYLIAQTKGQKLIQKDLFDGLGK